MASDDPFGADNPFAGMPFLGDLAKMLGQQGPIAWDAARQLAHSIATDGAAEPNVDPIERIRLEQLSRVADLHVSTTTGLTTSVGGQPVEVLAVTRTRWVADTLDAYRPLFERLAGSIGSGATGSRPESGHPSSTHPSLGFDPDRTGVEPEDPFSAGGDDPTSAWLGSLMQFLNPMMMGMAAGSMVGHLARRSFGLYDLPIPRPAGPLLVVAPTVTAFGQEWSLDADDLALWVCLHEITHHAVLAVPHVRARLEDLIASFVAGFRPDSRALEERMSGLEMDPSSMGDLAGIQQMFSDPEVLLGAMRSPEQEQLLPRIDALVAAIVGYVDNVMDRIGTTLIGTYPMVTEAVRRRRVEASDADRFVEKLFGLQLTQDRYDRGAAFIDGVVERAGTEALDRLWSHEAHLPTPAEIDAPGLWLARIDLPA